MPYHVEGDNESCDGYAVVKDDDGEVMGCHDSMSAAHAQMAALYASDENARAAVAVHHTATARGSWDGPGNEARLPSPMSVSTARGFYAVILGVEAGEVRKEDGKLGHHSVDGDGNPGPAVLNGVRNALARLPQTDGLSDAEREGARQHLQAHLDDADGGSDSTRSRRRSGPLGPRDRRQLPEAVVARLTDAFGEQALTVAHRGFDIDYRGKRLEHRACRRVELRQSEGTDPVIHGYATVYGESYDVWGGPPLGFRETIEQSAADKSVREQDEVYLFFDHEGLPLAATKAGTLTLASDRIGLFNEARPDPASPYSMEIVSRLARGELDAMSFAFEVTRQDWNDDYTERSIREVRLFDVSVVSYPANPATVVGLRSAKASVKRGMSIARARAEMQALALRAT